MKQYKFYQVVFALSLCLVSNILYGQLDFHLKSVTRPLSDDEIKGTPVEKQKKGKEVTFGNLLNIEVEFKAEGASTTDQALIELKKYYLVIDGRPYPEKNLGSMQIVNYGRPVKKSDTIKTREPTNGTETTVINSTISNTITFQTVIDQSHSDTNNKKYEQSTFWQQHYVPLQSSRVLNVSLLAPGITSQSITESDKITLRFYDTFRIWIFVVAFLAIVTFTIVKAAKDKFKLLRDDLGGCNTEGKLNPFSLSRAQVLLWTFVILGMAAYLWSVTDFFPAVTAAHLVLLGIAAGQRIIAQMIDSTDGADKQPGLAVNNATPENAKCSVGFFTDIISDSTGLSITRLQYLIITFIYLVMFVTTAIQQLKLMDFSIEQLALMGTSAGVYLWDKQLNKKAANAGGAVAVQPAPPPPPANPQAPQQPDHQ